MRRILVIAILLAIGFWGAWPAYSGWRIHEALKGDNAATLERMIDLPSVRASLRPVATIEAEKHLDEALARIGPGGMALGADIKRQVMPGLIEGVLANLVTAPNILRIYREGGAARDAIRRILAEEMEKPGSALGGLGGLGGLIGNRGAASGEAGSAAGRAGGLDVGGMLDRLGGAAGGGSRSPVRDIAAEPAVTQTPGAATPAGQTGYGLGNIKSIGFNGPLSIVMGLARDAAATDAEVTVEMSFTGLDWRLTGLAPRL